MTKPWTVSRGPISATDTELQKAGAINSLLIRPIEILPTAPGHPMLPFARGLFTEIRALLKPDTGVTKLRRKTSAYVHSKRYYFASAQPDSMRHDIDGRPIEPLSADDRLVAQQRFLKLRRSNEDATVATENPPPPEFTKADQIRAALLNRNRLTYRSTDTF